MAQQWYTHETVPTSIPAPLTTKDAMVLTDAQKTFFDGEENFDADGNAIELPVKGAVAAEGNMVSLVMLFNMIWALIVATYDTHIKGKNPTMVSGYIGLNPYTLLFQKDVASWTNRDNPINPTAGFTVDDMKAALDETGVWMVWPNHAMPDSPLYHIRPAIFREALKNPNLQQVRKGTHFSQVIPNFTPESYSAVMTALGDSLGLIEMLRARGVERVFVIGVAGDFCPGNTAIDLAKAGFEVWVVVDAQASVKQPDYDGAGHTSEELIIAAQMAAGVKHVNTQTMLAVNSHLLKAS